MCVRWMDDGAAAVRAGLTLLRACSHTTSRTQGWPRVASPCACCRSSVPAERRAPTRRRQPRARGRQTCACRRQTCACRRGPWRATWPPCGGRIDCITSAQCVCPTRAPRAPRSTHVSRATPTRRFRAWWRRALDGLHDEGDVGGRHVDGGLVRLLRRLLERRVVVR
eukprot:3104373-Prymnesium_polylepis.1